MKNNPYVGPRPYRRSDQHNFYGRDREARELRALIVAEREVLFYAQSGAGKTSLLNAVVIPALEERGFFVLPVARVGSELPQGVESQDVNNVFVFGALLTLAGEDVDPQTLLPHTLRSFLVERYPEPEDEFESQPLVLILDQFEEILTSHQDRWQDAEGFFRQVREALDTLPRLGVVFAMREDHVAGIDPYAPLFPRRLRARFRMERLGPKGALAAVSKPAANGACPFDPGVAEQLVDNLRLIKVQHYTGAGEETVTGPFVEPVQLQVVCHRLWTNLPEQADHAIQWEEVEEYGNVDRALTDFYTGALDAAMQETDTSEQDLRRWVGRKLVTPVGTRGLAMRGPKDTEGLDNAAVDVLEGQHLIRADVRAGARWYELAHDRLVDPILQSNAAWEATLETPLRTAARRWQETGNASLLYRDVALTETTDWAKTHPDEITAYEQEFLQASQQAQQARSARIRLIRTGLIAVLAVGLVLMGFLASAAFQGQKAARLAADDAINAESTAVAEAFISATAQANAESAQAEAEIQRQQALAAEAEAEEQRTIAQSRQLAAQSYIALDDTGDGLARSILLAVESLARVSSIEGSQALRQGLNFLPRLVTQVTHESSVNAIAFSPDGLWTASGSADGVVRVWDAETGTEIAQMTHEGGVSVTGVAFSPNGERVVSGGTDGTARVWNAQTGAEVAQMLHDAGVSDVTFSPDGEWVASASTDGTARVWEAETGAEVAQVTHNGEVVAVVFSSDGQMVVSGSWNEDSGEVWVWQATSGANIARMKHDEGVNSIAIHPDGQWVASGSDDGTARVWDIGTGREVARTGDSQGPGDGDAEMSDKVTIVAFSQDGRWLASGDNDGLVQVWDLQIEEETTYAEEMEALEEGEPPEEGEAPERITPVEGAIYMEEVASMEHTEEVSAIAFDPHGHWLVTAGWDRTTRVWELENGTEIARAVHGGKVLDVVFNPDKHWFASASEDGTAQVWETEAGEEIAQMRHTGWVNDVVFSPDGQWLATASSDATVRVWGAATGDEIVQMAHTGQVWSVAFSPDGQWLASGSSDYTARVWDISAALNTGAASGQEIAQMATGGRVRVVTFSPDGQWLATGGDDSTARVWDAATGVQVSEIMHLEQITTQSVEQVWSVAFSPDGQSVASGGTDRTARVWDAATGDEIARMMYEGPVTAVAFSPDGLWGASASEHDVIQVWEAATGQEIARMGYGERGNVQTVAFSPDGQLLASGDFNGAVRVWDAAAGEEIAWVTHDGKVNDVVFSPDGEWLASASDDRTARVWTAATGEEVARMSHSGPVVSVAFNPDGQWLATGSRDETARVWKIQSQDLVTEACARLLRNLTWDEWLSYIGDDLYQRTCDDLPIHPSAIEDAIVQAENLTVDGNTETAYSTYEQAIQWVNETEERYRATLNADICWSASLYGFVDLVFSTCEHAVELAPDNGKTHQAVGLARALTGDHEGAIADLQFAVEWWQENANRDEDYQDEIAERQDWITELQAGRNPFDEQTLESLRDE